MSDLVRSTETAKVVALEQPSPLIERMCETLNARNFRVDPIILSQDDFASWLKREHEAQAFGFDFDQFNSLHNFQTKLDFGKFVLEASIDQKLCVIDNKGLDIFASSMVNSTENIVKKVNLHSAHLTALSQAYEEITRHWSQTHEKKHALQFGERLLLAGNLLYPLRYGENPHQVAALYKTALQRIGVTTAKQVLGKQLSYNNINDTDAAYECVAEFDPDRIAACAIIKHANPCGVAEAKSVAEAYRKAFDCDPVSAFGGIVAINRELDVESARIITEIFTEVIIAPSATEDAISIVSKKKNLRLLLAGGLPDPSSAGVNLKSVAGGMLVQSRDEATIEKMKLEVVTKTKPTESQWEDLRFAFRVAKHVKSNTIVYAKDRATVGIGAGQMSRVDSARIAVRKAEDASREANEKESRTDGSVVASDAFFPFADGLLVAIEAGAKAVIQPGGSMRDKEVIKAANDAGIAMVFTGTRHFRH